jgi:aspartate 1-decarboxylase
VSLNGAAARKAQVGDILIICTYAAYDEVALRDYRPTVVLVGENNRAKAAGKVLRHETA